MTYCEDYPCCGHTDGLGCGWTYTPAAQALDAAHFNCEHYAGFCELYESDEPHVYDHDDTTEDGTPWCYGCDAYATCGDYEPDPTPCCPDPGCGGRPCTFPGYAANH